MEAVPAWLKLLETFGVYLGGLIYFVYRSEKRYDELSRKVDAKDEFIRTNLTELTKASLATTTESTVAIKSVKDSLADIEKHLRNKPNN